MQDRTYTALVYHHPRGFYVAECLAFPGISSEGANAAAALAALTQDVAPAVRAGEPETDSEAVITSLGVLFSPTLVRAYTAVVTREPRGYASYCPALGVASQGETVDEALAMLHEASTQYLESQPAPMNDERVYVERIIIPVADGAPISQAS